MPWKIILCILFGYLVGGINPSYIIGRLRGFDIRKKGSGNAGASNAVILMGKAIGIFSALFDIAKAAAVMLTAPLIFKSMPFAAEIAGVACLVGHVYPVFMKFRGGKGLACLGGMLIAIDWRMFLIALALEIVLVLVVDYICFVPITASILTPIVYAVFGADGLDLLLFGAGGRWGAAILAIATLVILSRHVENIGRIKNGTELHFSYLWRKDKDAEIARVMAQREKLETESKN